MNMVVLVNIIDIVSIFFIAGVLSVSKCGKKHLATCESL